MVRPETGALTFLLDGICSKHQIDDNLSKLIISYLPDYCMGESRVILPFPIGARGLCSATHVCWFVRSKNLSCLKIAKINDLITGFGNLRSMDSYPSLITDITSTYHNLVTWKMKREPEQEEIQFAALDSQYELFLFSGLETGQPTLMDKIPVDYTALPWFSSMQYCDQNIFLSSWVGYVFFAFDIHTYVRSRFVPNGERRKIRDYVRKYRMSEEGRIVTCEVEFERVVFF